MAEREIDSNQLRTGLQDRYELLEQLGRGAFGTVFKAVQKSTGQLVAIKVQLTNSTDPGTDEILMRRFQREARLCATLNHPDIVRLVDQGRWEDHLFIVFEYVPGETLASLLARQGALSTSQAVSLMAQVLEALEAAHRHGIIHRDLKPENLMVISTGTQSHIKILDFGIGTFASSLGSTAPALTRTHEMLGTPSYCAPEQLRGEPATIRSDLYSWGLVLLECLTGRRVMDGATVAQVVHRQLSAQEILLPTPLATHPLGDILRRVLAKAPRERSADAGKLWEDLRRVNTADLVGDLGMAAPAGSAGVATVAAETVRASGEKRQATLFCASLSVRAAPGWDVDVETLDAVQRDQQALCVDVVTRFGGHVAGSLGDRSLAVFGLPEASDSDARRAAHAALELASRIRTRRAALLAHRGIDLEVRIGIHTDIILVDVDGLPAGPALGIVARVESFAPAGSILVTETTRKILARQLRLQAVDPLPGGPATPPLHLLTAEKIEFGKAGAQSPMVGRDGERDLLVRLWDAALRGSGQVALIRGEPGIGKSRLVREIRLHADASGGETFDCHCLPEDCHTALCPIIGTLRRQFDLDGDDAKSGLARLEAALVARGLDIEVVMPILRAWLALEPGGDAPVSQLSPERQRMVLLEALARLLCPGDGEAARLIVMEDLQWSDPTSRDLVLQIAATAAERRILLVLTARFEMERMPPNAQLIQLQGLDRAAVQRLVARQLEQREPGGELVDQILERTDGVPLFVEELARSLWEAQMAGGGGRVNEGAVPATLRDLLNGRLGRLGTARETAQVAAAIGREFEIELLNLVSSRDVDVVQGDLDRLVDAQLLDRYWHAGGSRYVFRHALIREAAWESMLSAHRRAVHRGIADAIEVHFPARASREPAHLARHYELGGMPDKAVEYRIKAAQHSVVGSAYREAVEHLQAGLALLDLLDEPNGRHLRELELRNTLGGVLIATEGFGSDAVVSTFTRSRELLDLANPSPEQRLTTLKGLWTFHNARGKYKTALEIVEDLKTLAAANDRPEFHMTAHQGAAETANLMGHFRDTLLHSTMNDRWFDPEKQTQSVMRYGMDPWLSALTAECIASSLLGRIKHARKRFAQGMAACEKLDSANHTAAFLAQGAGAEMFLATPNDRPSAALDTALDRARQALAIGERYGLQFAESYARLLIAMMQAVRGDQQGIADLERSIAVWKMIGIGASLSWHLAFLARGQHRRREYAAAMANARAALEQVRALGEGYGESESYRTLGLLLADPENPLGDRAEGVTCCRRALEVATQQEARWLELQAAKALLLLSDSSGIGEARRRLSETLDWFVREEEGLDLPLIAEVRELTG